MSRDCVWAARNPVPDRPIERLGLEIRVSLPSVRCNMSIMAKLNRVIGPVGLILYGVGVTLGAGIYALVGEMAGVAGVYTPVAFVLAGILAGLTALSYAELGSRFPESAGEAAYVGRAFNRRLLTAIAGYGVALSGATSAAVVLHGFAGYVGEISDIPSWLSISGALILLVLIAIWGVKESIWVAGLITLIEAVGLLIIIAVAAPEAVASPEPLIPTIAIPWSGLFAASVMAFFAFIGFEDIANMAEEVRRPHRTLPLAILVTLVVSSLFYVAVSWVAVRAMSPELLAQEGGPLAALYEQATGRSGAPIAYIALLAMVNGALVQVIMASRVLYGLSKRGLAPRIFGAIHAKRRTPFIATGVAGLVIAALALSGVLGQLAIMASTVTLLVFALVNGALLALRLRDDSVRDNVFRAPLWAPALGLIASLAVALGAIGAAL
jgi:APA family basic amino acid/polyamine antiporter